MKKILYAEIAVLILVLIVAVVTVTTLSRTTFAPDAPGLETQADTLDTPAEESSQETTQWQPDWKMFSEDRQLLAQQYFVYDCDARQFLLNSGSLSEKVYPASITKLATALVALEYLDPDSVVEADNVLDLVAWGSSVAELQKGDTLSVEMLIEAMLLPSGNDAAYVLAAAAGRAMTEDAALNSSDAVSLFMKTMNSWAQEIGMTGTHFVNPDGIHDEDHYMTFSDLAILGTLSMENDRIMQGAGIPQKTVQLHGEQVQWKNTNALINPASEYYCRYAVGLKTGQTPSAGSCLLSAFEMDGRNLIIGVFGCPEVDDRFDDTLQLFNQIVLN